MYSRSKKGWWIAHVTYVHLREPREDREEVQGRPDVTITKWLVVSVRGTRNRAV
jgi:hypothetical protein